MTFQCPECEHEPYPTIKGWKRHLTSVHNGYTAEQLSEAMGNKDEGVALSGEKSLEDFIANMPATEDEAAARQAAESDSKRNNAAEQREASKEARAAAKRIKVKFDALKDRVSNDVPKQMFEFAGIALSEKEQTWLGESIQTSFEVFGINFEVEPYSLTLRNPLWVLIYPLFVIAFITISKIIEVKKADKEEKEQK